MDAAGRKEGGGSLGGGRAGRACRRRDGPLAAPQAEACGRHVVAWVDEPGSSPGGGHVGTAAGTEPGVPRELSGVRQAAGLVRRARSGE